LTTRCIYVKGKFGVPITVNFFQVLCSITTVKSFKVQAPDGLQLSRYRVSDVATKPPGTDRREEHNIPTSTSLNRLDSVRTSSKVQN